MSTARTTGAMADTSTTVPHLAAAPVTVKVNVPVETFNGFFENWEGGLLIYSKGAVTVSNVQASDNSVNNSGILYGEKWLDNLNNNQTWFFTANDLDDVTINVNSINFTPSVWIFSIDEFGNWNDVDFADGLDGAVTFSLEDLAAGDYGIQIFPDQPWSNLLMRFPCWMIIAPRRLGHYQFKRDWDLYRQLHGKCPRIHHQC